jgi:hypothetical protein
MAEQPQKTATRAEDWAGINDLAFDFADGVVREIAVVAGDYVGPDGVLYYGAYPRLLVHIQMQGASARSVRLEFLGVRRFGYDYDHEASPALATDVAADVWEVQVLALKVTAEECSAYVTGKDGLGGGPFIVRG